jgi:predicted amidohydrolase YtcJ
VIPGLIDAHAHLMRGAKPGRPKPDSTMSPRARSARHRPCEGGSARAGKYVLQPRWLVLRSVRRQSDAAHQGELDAGAPNNPSTCSSRAAALHEQQGHRAARRIDAIKQPWVDRDASGKPTGRINDPGLAQVANKIPEKDKTKDPYPVSAAAMLKDLNRAGLTAANMVGCPPEQKEAYLEMEKKGELTFRLMCMVGPNGGNPENNLQRMVASIDQIKLFQGDSYIDDVLVGETLAYSDNMMAPHVTYTAQQSANWKALATAVAKKGMPLQQHATISESFPFFLDQIEAINKEYPIHSLRWAFCHMDQVSQRTISIG